MTVRELQDRKHPKEAWDKLIFGTYNHHEVVDAIRDGEWQTFRSRLIGSLQEVKFTSLVKYIWEADIHFKMHHITLTEYNRCKVRVTNYVNALRRGGLIPS